VCDKLLKPRQSFLITLCNGSKKEAAKNKVALLLQLEQLVSDMSSIYSKAKICDYRNTNKCDLSLEPGTVRH
jgi:hypothetical protein